MPKRHTWIWIVLTILMVIYGIAYYWDVQNQAPDLSSAQIQVAPVVRRVMVVDLDNIGNIGQQGILAGEDPLLGMKVPTNSPNQTLIDYVDSFDHLGDIDANGDGRLDSSDPMYQSLVLVYFDQTGKPVRLVSLNDAGIRAIVWRKRLHVPKVLSKLSDKFVSNQRNIIMTDESTRKLRIIPVSDNVIITSTSS